MQSFKNPPLCSSTWQTLLFDEHMSHMTLQMQASTYIWLISTTHSCYLSTSQHLRSNSSALSHFSLVWQPHHLIYDWSSYSKSITLENGSWLSATTELHVIGRISLLISYYTGNIQFQYYGWPFHFVVPCTSGNEQQRINKDYLVWKSVSLPAGYHKEISSILADQ